MVEDNPTAETPEVARPFELEVNLSGTEYAGVTLEWAAYIQSQDTEGRLLPALGLVTDDGEPLATATVNLEHYQHLEPNHVLIKTWAENEGVFESLVAAGVIEDTGTAVAVNQWGSLARLGKVLEPHATHMNDALARLSAEVFKPFELEEPAEDSE